MSYELTIVEGNLGGDPDTHTFESGNTVTNFSLAVNRQWKDREGNKKEETTWYRCKGWNGAGEALARFKKKGEPVVVDGRLDLEPGKDEDGNKNEDGRYYVNLICRTIKFVNYPKNGTANFDDPNDLPEPEEEEEIPF